MSTLLTSPWAALSIPAPALDSSAFADLADRVALHGIGAIGDHLPALAAAARRASGSDVLVRTLLDAAAPPVARERAFGRLAAVVAASSTTAHAHHLTAA